jgi:hypothetical protein
MDRIEKVFAWGGVSLMLAAILHGEVGHFFIHLIGRQ